MGQIVSRRLAARLRLSAATTRSPSSIRDTRYASAKPAASTTNHTCCRRKVFVPITICSTSRHSTATTASRPMPRCSTHLRRLPLGSRVLDFGCSTGRILGALGPGYDRVGVEISAAARRKRSVEGSQSSRSATLTIPRQSSFDAHHSADVFEHLDRADGDASAARESAGSPRWTAAHRDRPSRCRASARADRRALVFPDRRSSADAEPTPSRMARAVRSGSRFNRLK